MTNLTDLKTQEEAQAAAEYRKEFVAVMDEIRKFQKGFVPDWSDMSQYKYQLCYDHKTGYWSYENSTSYQGNNWPVFASAEDVEACIKALGSRLNILLKPPI